MPLIPGTKIGRYRIEAEIGAGGMGVVYRVFDEKLERALAIKVLAPGTLDDEGARKRFRNEARVLSRLNHPSIQTIHDFDTIDGHDLLVSELVDGVSLDARIARGPLPQKEVVRIGAQLAQGLAAAHGAGVLHRDLKPANLRVTSDDRLKILDFGLAVLTRDLSVAVSKTTESLTSIPSTVAGTLPYMSPEQLLGQKIDERSDIYSAGVVLFELATGHLPFNDSLVPMLTNSIVHTAPPSPSSFLATITPELERIILKCLEKDPELRYQSSRDLAADLRKMEITSSVVSSGAVKLPPKKVPVVLLIAAVVLTVVSAAVWYRLRQREDDSKLPRLTWEQLTSFNDAAAVPAVSRDGRFVAFIRSASDVGGSITPGQLPGRFGGSSASGQVWFKALPDGEAIQLTNTKFSKQTLAFSPDATHLYFTQVENTFLWNTYEVSLFGAQPPRMFMANASGLNWIGRDRLLFSEMTEGMHMALVTSNLSRTDKRDVYIPPDMVNGMAHRSALSPDGKWVLIVEMDSRWWIRCRLVPFDGSSPGREVGPDGSCTAAGWSPDGQWMYFTADSAASGFHVWRQRFPNGVPVQLTPRGASEEEGIAVMPDGSLITAAGTQDASLWIHDKRGERQITSEGFSFLPTLAPDGKYLYYLRRNAGSRSFLGGELWMVDVAVGTAKRVLPGFFISHYSVSHDGKKVVVVPEIGGEKQGIWIADPTGVEAPRQVSTNPAYRAFFGAPGQIIYEGGTLAVRRVMRINEDGSDERAARPENIMQIMAVSPDGKRAIVGMTGAKRENEAARTFIEELPLGPGDPVTVCNTCVAGFGAARMFAPFATWSHDGKWLYIPLRYAVSGSGKTVALPVHDENGPAAGLLGLTEEEQFSRLPGARMIPQTDVAPGATPDEYVFVHAVAKTNLFRIYLH